MLVLTRKIGEAIIINDNIRISIVDIGNGRVKIGVEAPGNVNIDREEIFKKKQAAKQTQNQSLIHDPEAAVPVQYHNRIAGAMPDTAELTPAVDVRNLELDYLNKPR
jgi:carbon storage regulator